MPPCPPACRPEFLNRLDEIIVFRQLTKVEVKQIADIMLKQVFKRAEEKGIKIDVTGGWVGGWPGGRAAGCLVAVLRGPPPAGADGRARSRSFNSRVAGGATLARMAWPCTSRSCPPIPQVAPSLCPPSLTISLPLPPLPLLAERFKDRLVDEGYNPAYGARPLRRAIMRLLEDSMAERMLAGDISEGDSVIIDGACPPHLVLYCRLCRWLSAGCVPVVGVVPARWTVFQRKPANTHTPDYPSPSLHTPPSLPPALPACSGRRRPDQRAQRRQADGVLGAHRHRCGL